VIRLRLITLSSDEDVTLSRITFKATREEGEKECTGTVLVGVPHDQGKGSTPRDSGGTYDSFDE
jgi:hypothetical protein